MTHIDVTVVIPTWNGAAYLREVLEAIEAQRTDLSFETLVIDSGSTDGTLEILAGFPRVRVHHIDKSDFGHGKTRNLGASLANGRFVAFLTQDATPAGPRWLEALISPLLLSGDVWGVFGPQVPRPHCPPLMKYEILGAFGVAGSDTGVTLHSARWSSGASVERAGFYSDVNSATRRDVLTDLLPYRDVPYGEDQLFGRDIIAAGKIKAFASEAAVIHSNDIDLSDFSHRIFDEAIALRSMGTPVDVGSFPRRLTKWARGVVSDSRRILRDGTYTKRERFTWLVVNPAWHWAKWRGYRWAETVDVTDDAAVVRHSLERRSATPA